MRLTDASKEVSISDMYLDLDFDRDECENKLTEHESVLGGNGRDKNNFERKAKLDASKFLLHETKSSFKMKSQFQISKKQFFSKVAAKDRPNYPTSSTDKLTPHYATSKSNLNSSYGSIRTSASVSSLGERKFEFTKKSNPANSKNNTELVVESYGFTNKPDYEVFVADTNIADESPPIETMSKSPDAKGIFRRSFTFTQFRSFVYNS